MFFSILDFNLDLDTYNESVKNQVINFTVDFEDDISHLEEDLSDPVKSLGNKILSRRSSVVIHKSESNNENVEETFDQILKVFFLYNMKYSLRSSFFGFERSAMQGVKAVCSNPSYSPLVSGTINFQKTKKIRFLSYSFIEFYLF